MTYSYATLQVPKQFYNLVRKKLLDAGYSHAVDDKNGHLDMHGIALCFKGDEEPRPKIKEPYIKQNHRRKG